MNTLLVLIFVATAIGVEGMVLASAFRESEQLANEYSRSPWVD